MIMSISMSIAVSLAFVSIAQPFRIPIPGSNNALHAFEKRDTTIPVVPSLTPVVPLSSAVITGAPTVSSFDDDKDWTNESNEAFNDEEMGSSCIPVTYQDYTWETASSTTAMTSNKNSSTSKAFSTSPSSSTTPAASFKTAPNGLPLLSTTEAYCAETLSNYVVIFHPKTAECTYPTLPPRPTPTSTPISTPTPTCYPPSTKKYINSDAFLETAHDFCAHALAQGHDDADSGAISVRYAIGTVNEVEFAIDIPAGQTFAQDIGDCLTIFGPLIGCNKFNNGWSTGGRIKLNNGLIYRVDPRADRVPIKYDDRGNQDMSAHIWYDLYRYRTTQHMGDASFELLAFTGDRSPLSAAELCDKQDIRNQAVWKETYQGGIIGKKLDVWGDWCTVRSGGLECDMYKDPKCSSLEAEKEYVCEEASLLRLETCNWGA